MKLAACYSVFDGTELLEHSINCIRKYVDYICILYQTKNWYGLDASQFDLDNVDTLGRKKVVDEIIHYNLPYHAETPHQSTGLEHGKRVFGKHLCLDKGCDYYFDIDVDEFYIPEEFRFAKNFIINRGICRSKLDYYNYYRLNYRSVDTEGVSSFICKIDKETLNSSHQDEFFSDTDPTRRYGFVNRNTTNYKFDKTQICMHNMTGVRRDIKGKYSSSSRINLRRDKLDSLENHIASISGDSHLLDYEYFRFPGMQINSIKLLRVDNIFNISV